jgi:hypothetical protein
VFAVVEYVTLSVPVFAVELTVIQLVLLDAFQAHPVPLKTATVPPPAAASWVNLFSDRL